MTTLMYHDVVAPGEFDASGFPGPAAATYKLEEASFAAHLAALRESGLRVALCQETAAPAAGVVWLTFDDGGSSSLTIADQLEAEGWRGHFFLATDYLGQRSFITIAQTQELRRRGHIIGTHSCSHPGRMSKLSWQELLHEWRDSRAVLEQALGEPVTGASVPGGYYSRRVAQAASAARLKVLFTSEPTRGAATVDGVTVLGRYTIKRGVSTAAVARLAQGQGAATARQWFSWNAKKVAKQAGGPLYLKLRQRLLRG